jgi:O-antigen/teichoic acid export membrane protein
MNILKKIVQLKHHSGIRKYFANTSWLLGERMLRMAVSLFVGIYVARYLGPERFGLLSYTLSFVLLFSTIATFGLNEVLVRELLQDKTQRKELLSTAFFLKIIGFLMMGCCIIFALQFTNDDKYTQLMISTITLGIFFQSFNVIDCYFQSQVQSKYIVIVQVIQLLITSLIKIILILNKATLIWFAIVFTIDQALLAILLLSIYRWKKGWFSVFSIRWELAIKLFKNAWPLIFSGMMVSIYMKIDIIMIKEMLDVKAVGIYSAAVKLCEVLYFLPVVVMTSLFPAIVEARKNSLIEYKKQVYRIYEIMIGATIIVAIITTFLADWIVYILYGSIYQEAVTILQIYIWAFVFVSLGVVSSKYLVAENLEIYALYRSIVGVIINITLNWYLIPIYGIKGAAFSTLITQIFVAYLFLFCFRSTRYNFWTVTSAFTFGLYKNKLH